MNKSYSLILGKRNKKDTARSVLECSSAMWMLELKKCLPATSVQPQSVFQHIPRQSQPQSLHPLTHMCCRHSFNQEYSFLKVGSPSIPLCSKVLYNLVSLSLTHSLVYTLFSSQRCFHCMITIIITMVLYTITITILLWLFSFVIYIPLNFLYAFLKTRIFI